MSSSPARPPSISTPPMKLSSFNTSENIGAEYQSCEVEPSDCASDSTYYPSQSQLTVASNNAASSTYDKPESDVVMTTDVFFNDLKEILDDRLGPFGIKLEVTYVRCPSCPD